MKKFNRNKKFKKKLFTKKDLLLSIMIVVVFTIVGVTYALFTVEESAVVLDVEVKAPINISIYVQGVSQETIPTSSSGFTFERIVCEHGSTASWDDGDWELIVDMKNYDNCVVHFNVAPYKDGTLNGADPVINPGLIPVLIATDGTVTIADTQNEWFNYSEKEWANAVIVNDTFTERTPGTVIPMSEIFQMYVWIPRYQYTSSTIVNASRAVTINFVDIDATAHPAFTFGEDEMPGFWFAKFEQGIDNRIVPGVNSVHGEDVEGLFTSFYNVNNTHGLDFTSDVHMMKNTDWGAVAYLSQSIYGICTSATSCGVVANNESGGGASTGVFFYSFATNVTGCSFSDSNSGGCDDYWNSVNGKTASTTHNITGIYDMAGGRSEYVMGFITDEEALYDLGFSLYHDGRDSFLPNYIYFNRYRVFNSPYGSELIYSVPGDAMDELPGSLVQPSGYETTNHMASWNNDFKEYVGSGGEGKNAYLRGGSADDLIGAGIFSHAVSNGGGYYTYISPYDFRTMYVAYYTSRSVITVK